MREYFADMTKIEDTLEIIKETENFSKKEMLLQDLLKLDCFRQHTRYNDAKDITTEFKQDQVQDDHLHELKVDFFISRGLRNLSENGGVDKTKTRYHVHEYIEIIYIYEGQYTHFVNGIQYQHQQGELCILNTNVLHRDEIIGKDDLVVFLCVSVDYLKRSIVKEDPCLKVFKNLVEHTKDKKNKEYILLRHKRDLVRLLMERIAKEQHEKLMGYEKVMEGCIERLIYLIFQYYQVELVSEQLERVEARIFEEIDQMIRKNIGDITRAELAERFFYTPDHINRIIKQNTGQSYVDYTKKLKLEYAGKALIETDQSINNIIKELGYNNKTYFYKMFTNEYGITPQKYRENYKKSILMER